MKGQTSNFDSNRKDSYLELRRFIGLFLSNWYWFVLSLFLSGLLVYGINNYSERVYSVSSLLLIEDDKDNQLSGLEKLVPGGDIFSRQQILQNEIGILKSYSLNYRVMLQLKDFHTTIVGIGRRNIAQTRHYKSTPFEISYDTLADQRMGVQIFLKLESDTSYSLEIEGDESSRTVLNFGKPYNQKGFNFKINLRQGKEYLFNHNLSNRYIFWFNDPSRLANSYRSKLSVQPVNEEATLVSLSVTGASRLQEAEYLNSLMGNYIQQGIDFKNETAVKTIEFIDKQLDLLRDSLQTAENNLEKFRLENNLIDLSYEGTLIKNKIESFGQERISILLQKQYYEYLLDYLKSKDESGEIVSPSVAGVTDPMLTRLVEDLSKLQNEKRQLAYNFSINQPNISLSDRKIAEAKMMLEENVLNNIRNSERKLQEVDSRLKGVERDLNNLPRTEKRLINIQRKFDLNNTVYTYMLEKRSEAGIAKASNVSGNRVIDNAVPINAILVKPQASRNYLFAIILGFILPGLYIFFVDQLHNRIIDKRDIEDATDVPIIGFIGHNSSTSEMPVINKPNSSLSESFRTIRTNLKYYLNGGSKAVISVTSTISGEGKTFFSLNLATVLSMLGKKVLIVGIDLRKPRLNKILNLENADGLSNYLIGEAGFEEVVVKSQIENLYFVPSGPIPPNPSELLESGLMHSFISRAKEEFDYVILDTPPVGIVSDALLLREFTDLNIFVIRQKYSYKSTLELIQNIHERNEMKNLTIAVNDIHISGYYGYGLRYGYGFYEGYGYNYGNYGTYGSEGIHKYYTED